MPHKHRIMSGNVLPRLALTALLALATAVSPAVAGAKRPAQQPNAFLLLDRTFIGQQKFRALFQRGVRENWAALPIGQRTAKVGLALVGTPYTNFTLAIDNRIESPSVNMDGMDCWTFFEIALATARLLKVTQSATPQDMLRAIEIDRYRGGRCTGRFDSRLHHLEDWQYDNQKRGLVRDITPDLPGARRMQREMAYMAKNWKQFRQLRADQSLIPRMAKIEDAISRRGIWYLPKSAVRAAESRIQDGDIISIVTTWPGTYTSHVGLAVRDSTGTLRFLHASRDKKKVILDSRLSDYLNQFSKHAGVMVARPGEMR